METIKERARKYACDYIIPDSDECKRCYDIHGKCEHDAYIQASVWMLGELTRWRDPKEELPEERRDVEVKTDKGKVSVCNMDLDELGHRFWNVSRTNYMIPDANIIGWREIHE